MWLCLPPYFHLEAIDSRVPVSLDSDILSKTVDLNAKRGATFLFEPAALATWS